MAILEAAGLPKTKTPMHGKMSDAELMRALKRAKPQKYGAVATSSKASTPAKPQDEPRERGDAGRRLAEGIAAKAGVDSKDPAAVEAMLKSSTGIESMDVALYVVSDLSKIPRPTQWGDDSEKLFGTMAFLQEFQPQNATEALLVSQMIAVYHAGLILLRFGLTDSHPTDALEMAFRNSRSLMNLFLQQTEALQKLRGKTPVQQKVVVEHVHVAPGARAVLGVVETAPKSPEGGRE